MIFTDFFVPNFTYAIRHMEVNSLQTDDAIEITVTDGYRLKEEDHHYSIIVERSLKAVDHEHDFASVAAEISLHLIDGISNVPATQDEIIDSFISFARTSPKGTKLFSQISFAISSMTAIMNDPPVITPPIPLALES